ncbi:hypothetical protein [Saccharothrix xinjiangensis]|uniref:Universal stress protein family protein n=1 Tax=Saccharothrix xinjiangensis TaxID=204798 RepID=A0ABV9YFJ6_9PSEU
MSSRPDALDAALWATSHVERCGRDLTAVRVTERALVAESRTADLVVLSARTGAERELALAVAASARCPVVAVPPGGTVRDDLPAVVGVSGDHTSRTTLLIGLALATARGTGVRAVCCTREPPATEPLVALAVVDRCARDHPEAPVDVRVARSHPVTGLIRHARQASLLVVGCTPTTAHSTSRHLLDRCPSPIALVGPLVARRRCAAAEGGPVDRRAPRDGDAHSAGSGRPLRS